MSQLVKAAAAAAFSAALTALAAHYFHLREWSTIVLAAGVAFIAFLSQAMDLVKKALEITKLSGEVSKLRRESQAAERAEEDKNRLVKLATAADMDKYVADIAEHAINKRFRLEATKDRLEKKPFISGEWEDK